MSDHLLAFEAYRAQVQSIRATPTSNIGFVFKLARGLGSAMGAYCLKGLRQLGSRD